MGVIGLLALHDNAAAAGTARALLADHFSDGGWGEGGASDSRSTALVLEAVAQAGVATAADPVVSAGLNYLHRAQVNDGSIAFGPRMSHRAATSPRRRSRSRHSRRYRSASCGRRRHDRDRGADELPAEHDGRAVAVRRVRHGRRALGTETAQAYPAFDGVAFPLPTSRRLPRRPNTPRRRRQPCQLRRRDDRVSSSTPSSKAPSAAFRGATASGSLKAKAGRGAARAGTQVTGSVIGASPRRS